MYILTECGHFWSLSTWILGSVILFSQYGKQTHEILLLQLGREGERDFISPLFL